MARTNKYTERRRKSIVTPYGQWLYPGKVTTIPGNNITMQGVPYPVLGVSDKGDTKMMMPGMDYLFKGNEVTEYPVMQKGGFGKRRVEKNGMEYLKDTDGYTGVVQKQTQHGLGVSRRYDAPVYQYYDNGNPVGESWRGAGDFQNDIVKDYESEPVVPFNRKYSNYDPNSLTFFKDLATGETPFKPYEMPLGRSLLNPTIGNGISQSVIAHSVPTYIPPAASPANTVLAYNEPSYFLAGQQMNKNKPYMASTSGIYASKWPTRDAAISNGVENGSSQQAFFEDLFNAVAGYMKNNGIDESVGRPVAYDIVAHHAMESSSGGRLPAPFNYGGVRIPGSSDYKSFNDMNDYAKYYFENTVGGRNVLEQAMKGNAMSLEDYMRMLKDNGYFEADLGTYTANTRKDGYARAQKYLDDISYQTGGKIHIKEKNRGKFTEAAQRAGKSVQAYAAQILANKDNYSPTLIKRANFARNAAKWKRQTGGDDKNRILNWMNYWYDNRKEQINNNYETYKEYGFTPRNFSESINSLKNVSEDISHDQLDHDIVSMFLPLADKIIYKDDKVPIDIKLHEFTHALNKATSDKTDSMGNYYSPFMAEIGDVTTGDLNGYKYDSYLDDLSEIYSRLNQFRYNNNFDPKHKWTLDEIKKLRSNKNIIDDNILNRYTDDFLLLLFNDVADNNVNDALDKAQTGGIGKYLEGNYLQPKTVDSVMGAWNDQLAKGFAKGDMIGYHVGNALNADATASAAAATQFGKNFTKDIMAGEHKTDIDKYNASSNFEVQENPSASTLYWPSEQNNNIQLLNNGYYGFPVIDNGGWPYKSDQTVDTGTFFTVKGATGGSFSTPAEIERGEVVSTPTGDSIANGLMDYHELFSNRNEKEKNIVNLTNDMGKDVQRNPQLTSINERVNKYTAMRRNGKTFIFPSTVGRNGEILEPKNGNFYWLAKTINKK